VCPALRSSALKTPSAGVSASAQILAERLSQRRPSGTVRTALLQRRSRGNRGNWNLPASLVGMGVGLCRRLSGPRAIRTTLAAIELPGPSVPVSLDWITAAGL